MSFIAVRCAVGLATQIFKAESGYNRRTTAAKLPGSLPPSAGSLMEDARTGTRLTVLICARGSQPSGRSAVHHRLTS